MALYKKLDLWSITDGLDRMMDYCYNGNEKGSPYWGYYYEQINELSIAASDMYIELDTLKSHLYREMPYKKIAFSDEDDCDQTAIAWFNTAAAMLYDTDMTELLENENIFCADEWEEKKKRIASDLAVYSQIPARSGTPDGSVVHRTVSGAPDWL